MHKENRQTTLMFQQKNFLKRVGTELRVGYTAVKSEYVHSSIFVKFYMQADFIYPDGIPKQDEVCTLGI